jgi:hypothetical protein
VLRTPLELRAQVFSLRGDSGGAGVEVTLPGHIAAERDEKAGAETELFSAEQRRDDDVAAAAQASVGAQGDALAQPVRHQHVLRLGQPEFPRRAGVLDRRQRGCPSASVVP